LQLQPPSKSPVGVSFL